MNVHFSMYTCIDIYIYICNWLVVWNIFLCFHLLGTSSSQLTNSIIFERGRYTTNQISLDNNGINIWWYLQKILYLRKIYSLLNHSKPYKTILKPYWRKNIILFKKIDSLKLPARSGEARVWWNLWFHQQLDNWRGETPCTLW